MFNDLSRLSFPGTAVRLFNELAVVKIGGKVDVNENIYDYFNGIIAGECLINVLTFYLYGRVIISQRDKL